MAGVMCRRLNLFVGFVSIKELVIFVISSPYTACLNSCTFQHRHLIRHWIYAFDGRVFGWWLVYCALIPEAAWHTLQRPRRSIRVQGLH